MKWQAITVVTLREDTLHAWCIRSPWTGNAEAVEVHSEDGVEMTGHLEATQGEETVQAMHVYCSCLTGNRAFVVKRGSEKMIFKMVNHQ